ncbi:MAG TPA: amino acid-binding protein, partial [bacterium]|nr:amino acid-binding protein [bacterium]
QLSIFLENKAGQLAKCLKLMADNEINVYSVSIVDNGDFGIIRFIVDDSEKALELFTKNNFTATLKEVIAVELDNEIGTLYRLSKLLAEKNINIQDSFGVINLNNEKGLFIFQVNNVIQAIKILEENQYKIITTLF